MDKNAKIPSHSVLLVVDDRKSSDYFNIFFRQYWKNGAGRWSTPGLPWTIRSARFTCQRMWLSPTKVGWTINRTVLSITSQCRTTRRTNISRGNYRVRAISVQAEFGKAPIAIIWPGGGFGIRPVGFARKAGYRLGFTTNPRWPADVQLGAAGRCL